MAQKQSRYKKTSLPLPKGKSLTLYVGANVRNAVAELTDKMSVWEGSRLAVLLEAVYEQGKRVGARDAFEAASRAMEGAQDAVPHRLPGRPRRR